MELSKSRYDDTERVKNAAKELIRAVVWENMIWGGGEQQEVLDKVIDRCFEQYGDNLIEHALLLSHNVYLCEFIDMLQNGTVK